MEREKIVLTNRDRKILYSGLVIVLVALAVVSIALGSIHKSPLNSCKSIILQHNRHQCLQKLAISTGNISICNYIKGADNYACIAKVAEEESNLSSCNAINKNSTYYDNCIYNTSYSSNSFKGCEMIKNSAYKSDCIYALAEKFNFSDISYCNLIPNSTTESLCTDMYYYNRAVTSGNYTYCLHLPSSTNNTVLYSIMKGKYSTYNVSIPIYYSVINVTPQDLCYYKLALLERNLNLCRLTGKILESTCSYKIQSTNNTKINITNLNISKLCSKAPSYMKKYCELGVGVSKALQEHDIGICLNMSSEQFKESCIDTLATNLHEASYCLYISNNSAQKACYLSVSNYTK